MKLTVLNKEQYKKMLGEGIKIFYGFHTTPFGKCLVGRTSSGICHLSFSDKDDSDGLRLLASEWPKSILVESHEKTKDIVNDIFYEDTKEFEHNIIVPGTEFQGKVWNALLNIPKGSTVSYEDVANMIGQPKSIRASANAIANNRVAYLIPCHRVISKSGKICKYASGVKRKINMLTSENPQFVVKKNKLNDD